MTMNNNITNNDFIVNNNDFVVYDVYKENNEMKYFFVCQNTGEEKTLNSSFILDIFKDSFLMILDQELEKEMNNRLSLIDFYASVWKTTCKTLNTNSLLSGHYTEDIFNLTQELNTFDKEDIFKLNIDCYYNGEPFVIFRDSKNNLNIMKKDDLLSKVYDLSIDIKNEYLSNNISKKMVEINKEALNIICSKDGIKYFDVIKEEDMCNHEFEFTKKHEPLNSKSTSYFYSFTCKHCGKIKNLLNYEIINEVQKNSIQIISNQISLPKRERRFNFKLFDMAISNFLEKEKIDTSFIQEYTKDYSLPKLNKEIILINPEDLTNSSLVFTNTICKSSGIFKKEILKDINFIITKDNNGNLLFTEKN